MELPKPPHLPAIASDIVAQHEVVDKSQLVDEQQDEKYDFPEPESHMHFV